MRQREESRMMPTFLTWMNESMGDINRDRVIGGEVLCGRRY